jgi:hypothetical protein
MESRKKEGEKAVRYEGNAQRKNHLKEKCQFSYE